MTFKNVGIAPITANAVDTAKYYETVKYCNQARFRKYIPLCVGSQAIGMIHPKNLYRFAQEPSVFVSSRDGIILNARLKKREERSEAIAQLLEKWRRKGWIPDWRNERYAVCSRFGSEPLFEIERGAATIFGIETYSVHINGIVRRGDDIHMWLAKRSLEKSTYPGEIDNLVGGGLTSGQLPCEVATREAYEEANISEALLDKLHPAGVVSLFMEIDKLVIRESLFVYDLELSETFAPSNNDGEVDEFMLWPLDKVAQAVADRVDIKTNCNLILIDFFVRHSVLRPEDEHYIDIVQGLAGNIRGQS